MAVKRAPVQSVLLLAFAFANVVQAQSPAAMFNQYCVTCHNARLKTGNFVLDPAQLSDVAGHAETWEKVVRKLRSGAMPPAGLPRPDAATYNSSTSFLETALDRAKPNPGKLPLLHRLTRTEYRNSIRDLLAIDALPKEMDTSCSFRPTIPAAASTTSPNCSSSRQRSWNVISMPRGS